MATLNGLEIFPKLKHIKISNINERGNINEELADNQLIELLYTLAYKSEYVQNDIIFSGNHDDFSGIINISASYKDYINYLIVRDVNNNHFYPNLTINYDNCYILFKDENVESTIVNNYINTFYPSLGYTGVIENLPMNQVGNVDQYGFRKIFKENKVITSFDELSQLKNAKCLATEEFRGTYNLTSIDLTNVEYIGWGAFLASGLEWFHGKSDDPNEKGILSLVNLTTNGLQGYAFETWNDNGVYRGPKIKKIVSLGACQTIKGSAFYLNQTLESIEDTVLEILTGIDADAFGYCRNLVINDLKLPNVTTIGNAAFCATKVKKISVLKPSVTINYRAFEGCELLTSISEWSEEDYGEDETKTVALQNIKAVGDYAFNNCTNLVINDLKMPLLTSIGVNAFANTGVKKISDLGNIITTVKGFANCTNLTTINLPNSVNAIGESAFANCTSLRTPDNMFTKYAYFEGGCFSGITTLPSILYLPKVTTCIGYTAFKDTNINCIYMPNATHTRGPYGKQRPSPMNQTHRGGNWKMSFSQNTIIVYFKNLTEICSGIFGANMYADDMTVMFQVPPSVTKNNLLRMTTNSEYSISIDGTRLQMFNNDTADRGGKPVPINSTRSMGESQLGYDDWWQDMRNIKYLIINNTTPPISYFAYTAYYQNNWYGWEYGAFGIWGKNEAGTKYSFKYLVVPRSAIETYKTWQALSPNIDTTYLSAEEIQKVNEGSTFDINKIIALESMPHVATKADWDAIDDSNQYKYDYLIEEYMGLTAQELSQIQWDAEPTFRE